MTCRNLLNAAIAPLMLMGAPIAMAQTPNTSTVNLNANPFTLDTPRHPTVYRAEATESAGLLQSLLRDPGYTGFLEEYGVRFGGHAQAGYTYNFQRPDGDANGFGRLFDSESEDLRIDQVGIFMARDAIVGASDFDMGFGFEFMYGSDMRFIHANGANFYGSVTPPVEQDGPDAQFDLTQAFVTLNAPFGNGVLFTFGKFVTPWGLEHINSTLNAQYSHSYIFSVSQPQTLTGVTARYQMNDQFGVMGGVVVGWDQAIDDNNDFPSFVAQVTYKYAEDLDFVFSGIVGPEKDGTSSDYRWMLNGIVNWRLEDGWKVGVESVLGYEPDVGTEFRDVVVDQFGTLQRQFLSTGDDAMWFAAAAYSSYRIDPEGVFTFNARGEYFADPRGARYFPTEVYEATAALDIVPFRNNKWGRGLLIRPEVRYDYSIDDIFDGGQTNNQITAAVGVLYRF